MKFLIILFAALPLCLALTGCGAGMQHSQFTDSGDREMSTQR